MNRQKYKITAEEFKKFEHKYLLSLLSDEKPMKFGEAFLREFQQIVHEYSNYGGDFGMAEATKLWNESDINKAKLIIKHWIK